MSTQEPTQQQVAAAETLATGVEQDLGLPPGSVHTNPLDFNPDGKKPQDNIPLEGANLTNGDSPVVMGMDPSVPGASLTGLGMLTITGATLSGPQAEQISATMQPTTASASSQPPTQQPAQTSDTQADPSAVSLDLREEIAQTIVAVAWTGVVLDHDHALSLVDELLKKYDIHQRPSKL